MDVRKRPIGVCPHGLRIYLVDGSIVRNEFDSDYVQGGNPERYKWIPKGEIWIDDSTPKAEVSYVALHECDEAKLMSEKGEGYEQAHDEAKELENKARHKNFPGDPQVVRCALITCYNGQGQLLMGKRNDNERYTLPGGHIEEGESPHDAAVRELYEETGLRSQSLSFLKEYALTNGTELYCFSAYVTGEPHSKNDPDDEVSEWEWIDVEEGLPPKVYDHLHGPQDQQNLIKQLFQLQKAEWEELFKRAKLWHSDDWGNKRITIPSMEHPDRPNYDKGYGEALTAHYGALRPVKVTTDQLVPKNDVHDKSRYNLYRKMYRAGETLPPMVVKRNSSGLYDILDGNHKYHAVKAEGGGHVNAVEQVPDAPKKEPKAPHIVLSKAVDDEVYRLLDNPDPVERRMALRLDSVRPEHLFTAAMDPDPSVYQPAIDDPRFGPTEAQSLMEAVVGKNGMYPDDQKRLFLMRHGRVLPFHFTALARAAKMCGPARYATAVSDIAAHPMAPQGMLRSLYLDPDVGHDARMAILGHLHAAPDVLDHAVRTAIQIPGGASQDLGKRAVEHLEMPYGTLRGLVERAADRGEPHLTELAIHALEYNQGLTGPALGEIFRDLLPKVQMRSSVAAPQLLAALLRNGKLPPQLADEATHILPPEILLKSISNPVFGPQHLQQILSKALDALAPADAEPQAKVARHPIVTCQLGFDPLNHPSFRAARFLALDYQPSAAIVRTCLYQEDGDVDRAALAAHNLPITDENLASLHAIKTLSKDEGPILEPTPHAEKIVTAHPEGEDVADMIRRAFKTNFVFPVALGGKHSKGSFIAYDKQTHTTVLLKSGSGGAGGAAGSTQEQANPNAREAAFYYVAKDWKIGKWFPRAEEVIIDERPYAALQLLALDFSTLDAYEKKHPGTARRVLAPYLYQGLIHKWAVIDYVLGNPDRHGQNVMVDPEGAVRLIDHGSAFAGTEFDPAHDGGSFVPYYLRAWALDENFNKLSPEDKIRNLPRVPHSVAQELKTWAANISVENLKYICQKYGIDPSATLARLGKFHIMIATNPVDLVIDQLWVTT